MNGFTLFETIVATGLILVGLVGALALITTSLFYVSNIQDRLIAANLAAEGIEMVRNIRDNNWLRGDSWNSGLANGDYQVAYNSMALSAYSGQPFLFDSTTNLYDYDISGTITPYVRKISITNMPNMQEANEIKVVSEVTWQRRGVAYSSSAEDHLFNWK